jgi:hypothetical protein
MTLEDSARASDSDMEVNRLERVKSLVSKALIIVKEKREANRVLDEETKRAEQERAAQHLEQTRKDLYEKLAKNQADHDDPGDNSVVKRTRDHDPEEDMDTREKKLDDKVTPVK